MIESSFCFLPGVGSTTERRLWGQGLLTWTDFLSRPAIDKIGASRKALYDVQVEKAQEQYAGGNARYFGVVMPAREHWRLYDWLRSRRFVSTSRPIASVRLPWSGSMGMDK